jgi:hypothetical protein
MRQSDRLTTPSPPAIAKDRKGASESSRFRQSADIYGPLDRPHSQQPCSLLPCGRVTVKPIARNSYASKGRPGRKRIIALSHLTASVRNEMAGSAVAVCQLCSVALTICRHYRPALSNKFNSQHSSAPPYHVTNRTLRRVRDAL